MLKAALIRGCDHDTVSNTYAEEIKTRFMARDWTDRCGREATASAGILNGIDYDEFQSDTDKRIVQNYNAKTFRGEIQE